MKIEQHIYTSGEPEFATLAITSGINRDERIKLENHSLYILPPQLLYEEKKAKPIKYVFYPLNENRLVIGKAVYIGKDNIGRPGNYFFHNLIINKEELIKFEVNPSQFIKYVEKKGIFKEKVANESLQVLELTVGELKEFKFKRPQISNEFIKSLIYFCFNYDSFAKPLLIIGSDRECLDFLEWLYELLPYGLKENVSFDTYSYGTNHANLNFKIVGNPKEPEFQQNVSYSLRLDLETKTYTVNYEQKDTSELVSFVAERIYSGDIAGIKSVYLLQDCLRKNDFEKFREVYKTIPLEAKDFIYRLQKNTILNHILAQNDIELLQLVIDKIELDDMSALSSSIKIMSKLVESANKKILEMFIDWFCAQTERISFYQLIFKSSNLWKLFLGRLRFQPQNINFLLEDDAFGVFKNYYSTEFEEALLEEIFLILPEISENKKLSRSFSEAINSLPASDFKNINLLKSFIKYELNHDSALLEILVSSDLSIFSEKKQESILDSILQGIIESNKLEVISKQLNLLFEKAKDKQNFVSRSLTLLKQYEIPNKTKKLLKSIFLELSNKLPQNEETKNFKDMADKLFEIKPSLIRQLLGRKDKG